jgi:ketosteroid isomerase-like protein
MAVRLSALILLALTVSIAPAQSVVSHNDAEAAYLAYVAAWKAKDLPALSQIIADDYSTLNGENKLATKADELAEAKSDSPYDRMEVTTLYSHVMGDTATLSGLLIVSGQYEGKPYTSKARFLATMIHRKGHWQLVADESAATR